MANYTVNGDDLTDIADAIIAKAGLSGQLEFPDDFVDGIEGISTGTDVSDTTATEGTVLSGYCFHKADGSKVQGSIVTKNGSDLSASGKTVTVPAGYYASQATKDVATGTAGTPTATKGAVSSHAITVTPSVTNTTGYITGSTKTGTPVTVAANELVSGTKNITQNGNNIDVINYASVNVNVSGGGGGGIKHAVYEYFGAYQFMWFDGDSISSSEFANAYVIGWADTEYGTSIIGMDSSVGSSYMTIAYKETETTEDVTYYYEEDDYIELTTPQADISQGTIHVFVLPSS